MKCYQCGKADDGIDLMWPDGYNEQGDEVFLCQECHEAEVDADFWATVAAHPGIWSEPRQEGAK